MCHRAHSAASTITVEPLDGSEARNALIVGTFEGSAGDTSLCFSCHDGLGASSDIATDFRKASAHVLAPETSEYGPESKQCASCHDSHGTARDTEGQPYPALLQALDASGEAVHSGDEFCTTCHEVRTGNEFPGLETWRLTAHAGIETSAGGTGITCSACHEPHGSSLAPLLRTHVTPPAADATATVSGNDRSQCQACHGQPSATWVGAAEYATSAHATSEATVAVTGEWASEETSRSVGECQSCHAAMGAVDGAGDLISKLKRAEQPALCRSCHDADGPAATDFTSIAHKPGSGMLTVVAAFGGSDELPEFGGLDLFSRQTTSSATVLGPRRFAATGMTSPVVADFDGDEKTELVAAYTSGDRVAVLGQDRNAGLVQDPGDVGLLDAADLLAEGDVLDDTDGLPELITAHTGDDFVQAYRWSGGSFVPVVVGGRVTLPSPLVVTGMAVGSVLPGGRQVVLTVTDGTTAQLVVVSGGTALSTGTPVPLRDGAQNPVAVDHDGDAQDEIVVANSGVTEPLVSIVNADGSEEATAGGAVDASATAACVSDVLPDVSGSELTVSLAGSDGTSRVEVFPASGSGFASASQVVTLPAGSVPVALASGDVDGDSHDEVVAGLAGTFSRSGDGQWPGVAIVGAHSDGQTMATAILKESGAVEGAGSASVAVADLGIIGPSRHPVGESGSHVSTETAVVESHVVCSDCHNVHDAVATATVAPQVLGVLRGAWGVSVDNVDASSEQLTERQGVDHEYEVCLKCHSAWSETGTPSVGSTWPENAAAVRSIASEVNTLAASFHPVEGPTDGDNSADALVSGIESGSMVYCTDCHGTSAASGPRGPHMSPTAPLLKASWSAGDADEIGALCFTCHREDVYGPVSTESLSGAHSGFYGQGLADPKLHSLHASRGFSCASCHVSHGSTTMPSLLRDDIGWEDPSGSDVGACANECHTGGASHAYSGP